ncbi:hypothetical protein FRC00_001314 [Tulasnella sp. 408]|nr:hypothetical protein FRC00_001314 [Tulasnella sp. 408]
MFPPVSNNPIAKEPRAPNKTKITDYEPTSADSELRTALFELMDKKATDLFGDSKTYGAGHLMSNDILKRIIGLNHILGSKLTVEKLSREISWGLLDDYGEEVIELCASYRPRTSISPPSTPSLGSLLLDDHNNLDSSQQSSSRRTKPLRCQLCGGLGHTGTLCSMS